MPYLRLACIYADHMDNPAFVYDNARRFSDHLGPWGMKAKDGQSNDRIAQQGFLRLCFRNDRGLRRKHRQIMREHFGQIVKITYKRRWVKRLPSLH